MNTKLNNYRYRKCIKVIINNLYEINLGTYNPYNSENTALDKYTEITVLTCHKTDNTAAYVMQLERKLVENPKGGNFKRYYYTKFNILKTDSELRINLNKKYTLNKAIGILKSLISAPASQAIRKALKMKY